MEQSMYEQKMNRVYSARYADVFHLDSVHVHKRKSIWLSVYHTPTRLRIQGKKNRNMFTNMRCWNRKW